MINIFNTKKDAFPSLFDFGKSIAGEYISSFDYPFEALSSLGEFIYSLIEEYSVKEGYRLLSCGVLASVDAKISEGAKILPPCFIDKGAEIRAGAFIRGSVIIGKDCVVGNSSEIKTSVLFDEAKLPHFNYAGDSILGFSSHMGAGAIISNLKSDKSKISIRLPEREIKTDKKKLGALIGDFAEIGCNSVINPGSVIGKDASIYPLSSVRGYLEEGSIYKEKDVIIKKSTDGVNVKKKKLRLFGTDGIRGLVGEKTDASLAFKVGAATAGLFKHKKGMPKILLASDTRKSGDSLLSSLIAGICSCGGYAIRLGVLPTPALSLLIKEMNADAGIMLSASHNSSEYNGIKIFASNGKKLSDSLEDRIEYLCGNFDIPLTYDGKTENKDKTDRYIKSLLTSLDSDISELRIGVDCANGATYKTAKLLFEAAGCETHFIGDFPDGENINRKCGSTDISSLSSLVKEKGLDIGLAFDGDGDRLIAVDEKGEEVDGDKILAIAASDMLKKASLRGGIVGTVMSNLGLRLFCKENKIGFIAADVGDRHVLDSMQESGFNLGGEQSGHLIFADEETAGDGERSALILLSILARSKKPLSALASCMKKYPQYTRNIKVSDEEKKLASHPLILGELECERKTLGEGGRIILRASGTEPLIRITLEGECEDELIKIAERLEGKIQALRT